MGQGRQGLSVRNLPGRGNPGAAVPRPLPASGLSPDVWPGLYCALRILLDDRRRLQWLLGAPLSSRRDALGGLARALRQDQGPQADGRLELPLGLIVRERVQL